MQTFEQVNQHVERNFKKVSVPKSLSSAKSLKVSTSKLKEIYGTARPVLQLIANLGLLPKKWRAVVQSLISVLDLLTAQEVDE